MSAFIQGVKRLHPELPVALAAAWVTKEIVRRGWRNGNLVAEAKTYGDLFSEVDTACDNAIQAVLRAQMPNDGVCSEELTPNEQARAGRLWIVDPLDGSNAFIYRLSSQMPATLIALEESGTVVVSVVYFPLTGETFYAVKGRGAFRDGARLTTDWAPTQLGECCVEMNHYSNSRDETSAFGLLWSRLRSPQGARVVMQGPPYSGVAARIAQGEPKIAAVVHDNNPLHAKPKQCLWDVAAPALVLREAGGVVVNLRGGDYDPRRHETFICAANRTLAEQIILLAKD